MNLSKIIAAANQHKVYIPQHAEMIEYRIQVLQSQNSWKDHDTQPLNTMGLNGFSECKRWRDELIATGHIARIIGIGVVS